MKKLATLFSDSYAELKPVRSLTIMAMFAAISIVLGYFTVNVGHLLKIGFSTIANQFVYYLFGPVAGGVFGGTLDVLKYLIKPTGEPFFPGWTIGAILAGIIYGMFYYKKPLTIWRVLCAEFVVALVCNVLLGTLWLNIMYGKAFFAIVPMRAFKNLIMWPVNSILFFTIARTVDATGILRIIRGGRFLPGQNQ